MGWLGKFTGEEGATNANRRQQQLYDEAVAADPLNSAQNKATQQGIVNDMAAGKNANIDEAQYNDTFNRTVMPQINSGFGGNMWSTARVKAQQNGALDLRNNMTNQANQQRQNVLATLRGASENQANILGQKAGAYQNTKRGWLDTAGQVMNMGANGVAMYKGIKG